MAARFVAASSMGLWNTACVITDRPCTVGAWCMVTGAAGTARTIFCLTDPLGSYVIRVRAGSANTWELNAIASSSNSVTVGSVVLNSWVFIVARFITDTNDRLSILNADGSISHVQRTVSRPLGGNLTRIGFGVTPALGSSYMEGLIGEGWYTNTDIQADGAQLQDSTLRTLAFRGPFALSHIRKDIIEARRFKSLGLDSRSDRYDEVYWSQKAGRQTWTNTNGATIAPHCPAANRHRWARSRSGIVVPV